MKHLSVFLALLLLLGCLTGCGSPQTGKNDAPPSGTDKDPGLRSYTVCCYDADNGEAVEGVVINFCTDTACTPVTSGEDGTAVFTGPPANYHVQIVRIPAGWKLAQEETEWYTESFGETCRIPFAEVGE